MLASTRKRLATIERALDTERAVGDSRMRMVGAQLDALEKKVARANTDWYPRTLVGKSPLQQIIAFLEDDALWKTNVVDPRLAAAAERGRIAMDIAGTRVGYIGGGLKTGVVSWLGTVVPCPQGAHIKTHGTTGERFIWVVKDGATWAVGCYPSRLVRV